MFGYGPTLNPSRASESPASCYAASAGFLITLISISAGTLTRTNRNRYHLELEGRAAASSGDNTTAVSIADAIELSPALLNSSAEHCTNFTAVLGSLTDWKNGITDSISFTPPHYFRRSSWNGPSNAPPCNSHTARSYIARGESLTSIAAAVIAGIQLFQPPSPPPAAGSFLAFTQGSSSSRSWPGHRSPERRRPDETPKT